MIELNEDQRAIVETDASKVVVVAAAAAGKTAVLTERVRYLLNSGVNPKSIVLITFTNAAAEELSERLGHPVGPFIGTIHSYANFLLLSSGLDTSDLLDAEQFDKLFPRIKHHPECIRPVEHLLLDEAQDSNELHFEFLLDMIQPENYMLVGDHKQSIYRWNGAHPDYILNLTKKWDVTTFDLDCNYRNGYKILDFAKSIAAYNAEYGSWFVLTRTNEQIDTICHALKAAGVPYDTFKRAQLDNKELNKKMKENTVKVLTIHTAKGLEADNVVVIGSKFYNVEEKCISYVAATRAKNLLVWTRTKNHMKNKLANWETR